MLNWAEPVPTLFLSPASPNNTNDLFQLVFTNTCTGGQAKPVMENFLTVTDLGEGAGRPYKPLNVKHEKSAIYLQSILFVGWLNSLNLNVKLLILGNSTKGPLTP
ncbi:MAG: hypothetical protein D3903_06300 [Candidatus Electrothrix sp. GM3_4]|nr:hypothetical protein [Candidatus Electrothrix sp. GM3_4]